MVPACQGAAGSAPGSEYESPPQASDGSIAGKNAADRRHQQFLPGCWANVAHGKGWSFQGEIP